MFSEVWLTIFSTGQTVIAAFIGSTFFLVLKLLLAIYTTVLIVDIILLIHLGNVPRQLRKLRTGTTALKASRSADQREWRAIMQRSDSIEERQYAIAILEADRFTFRALEVQGYAGDTFAERISRIPARSFSSLNAIGDVHQLSNAIVQKADMVLTQEQTKNALGVYEKFLKDIDFL